MCKAFVVSLKSLKIYRSPSSSSFSLRRGNQLSDGSELRGLVLTELVILERRVL